MIGITIHGDYEDLKALHRAMSDYLQFYFENQDGDSAQRCYENILGLCYDIRHAFQGDRNVESVRNNHESIGQLAECIYEVDGSGFKKERNKYKNGNLYFNVEVLYPWAVYYLFTLHTVTEDGYQRDWLKNNEFGYTEYQAEQDLALIRYFVHLLWGKLREHLPEDVMKVLWDSSSFFDDVEYYFYFSEMYVEWLCTYWLKAFCDGEQRRDALPLLCFEFSPVLYECCEELEDIIAHAEMQNIKISGNSGDEDEEADSDYEPDSEYDEFEQRALTFRASTAKKSLDALDLYDKYLFPYKEMQEGNTIPYLNQDEFMIIIYVLVEENGPFTRESYDAWLDQKLGEVDWDSLEW